MSKTSAVRPNRVKKYLSGLRMSSFEAEGAEASATPEKTYKMVTNLAKQVPQL